MYQRCTSACWWRLLAPDQEELMGGLDPTDLLVVLAVLLLVFGGSRLSDLARGLRESMEEWRRPSPYEQQWRGEPPPAPLLRQVVIRVLAIAGLFVLAGLTLTGVISAGQAWAVVAVTAVWLIAGFYCFGRKG